MILNYIPPYWSWTEFTPEIPKLYWDVKSQEQRIKMLCMELDKLVKYSNLLAESINVLEPTIKAELDDTLAKLHAEMQGLRQELVSLVERLGAGELTWDVQHGRWTDSIEAQRNQFRDLTVNGITVEQLANQTTYDVDGLANSGWTVRGLAVYGKKMFPEYDNDTEFKIA